ALTPDPIAGRESDRRNRTPGYALPAPSPARMNMVETPDTFILNFLVSHSLLTAAEAEAIERRWPAHQAPDEALSRFLSRRADLPTGACELIAQVSSGQAAPDELLPLFSEPVLRRVRGLAAELGGAEAEGKPESTALTSTSLCAPVPARDPGEARATA